MNQMLKFIFPITRALASGARWAGHFRAGARMFLVAALLAPLATLTPSAVPVASAQLSNSPREIPARSTSARASGAPGLPPNLPQAGPSWTVLPNNGLSMGNGLPGAVHAFALCAGQLYVGGGFVETGDGLVTNLNDISRLNLNSNTWSALAHGGLNAEVDSLACLGSDLYVGGHFNQTADGALTTLNKIAKFDTTHNTWSALPHNGLSGLGGFETVFALQVSGSDLYAGGSFTETTDGAVTNLNGIARFSTSSNAWFALPHKGLSSTAFAFAVSGTDLYVGGAFAQTADGAVTNLGKIARFSTTGNTWSALPNQGLAGTVFSLAFNGGDLYVGGQFNQTADGGLTNLNYIAKYSTTINTWSGLPHGGLNGLVSALAFNGGDLYLGGYGFTQTFDGAVTGLNYIAKFSTATNTWSALPRNGLNSHVLALAFNGGNLYLGGDFSESASRPATVAAPSQMVLLGMALFVATQSCGSISSNILLQDIVCIAGGGTLIIGATMSQFVDGDVVFTATEGVTCGGQTIDQVRILTSDGVSVVLNGPTGATSGTFSGGVPLHGASGPVDLMVYCGGNPTPVTTVIVSITSIVLPPIGAVIWGCCLSVKLASANIQRAEVTLYYKDPALGDVVWNANAYNQLNPQTTTAGASGQFGWNPPSGQYFVKVSAPCFQSAQSSVVTVPPAITNLNITLTPVAHCTTDFLPFVRR